MPTRSVNGVELWHEDTGNEGEPILFHHGYTGSHDSWPAIIERLPSSYRCLMMDCRGAGDSSHPVDGYTIEQYAADVIALVDQLGIDRFTDVGHSMGGGIGMWLGLHHADRLDRLVLVAPVGSGGIKMPRKLRESARQLWYARDAEELTRQRVVTAARPETLDDVQTKARVERALSVSEGHFEESWASMAAFNVTDRLAELTTPTLMVAGAADALLRANLEDYLRLPNATLHVLSRVGHLIPAEAPDDFAELLADFLTHGVVNAATLQQRLAASS
jgi:pimeloyl-ACP methyl ester carboxylesterase